MNKNSEMSNTQNTRLTDNEAKRERKKKHRKGTRN